MRSFRRFSLSAGPIAALLLVALWYLRPVAIERFESHFHESTKESAQAPAPDLDDDEPSTATATAPHPIAPIPSSASSSSDNSSPDRTHNVLYSLSTPDKRFFSIKFGQYEAINPNILPRPNREDEYIIVAQRNHTIEINPYFYELACVAKFTSSDLLECVYLPITLPIAATFGDACPEDIKFMETNVGPHDARVFWGPERPLAMWQSNSQHTCISQFMQDFRLLFDWEPTVYDPVDYFTATEILRPQYDNPLEKNWFVFWDRDNQMYAHYDIFPNRSFAKLGLDGSAGPDLAPLASADKECLTSLMPAFDLVEPNTDSIHQATNSLSITMCRRADPDCHPTDENTFIFTIYHHKLYIDFHSYYEPYVMLFDNSAPFTVHAVSGKPLWIHGRKMQEPHAEMFFMVSMSWRGVNQTYHGYLDDEIFISMGIEDSKTAGIDVLASDLLDGMREC